MAERVNANRRWESEPRRLGPMPEDARRLGRSSKASSERWGDLRLRIRELGAEAVLDALGEDARCPECRGPLSRRGRSHVACRCRVLEASDLVARIACALHGPDEHEKLIEMARAIVEAAS